MTLPTQPPVGDTPGQQPYVRLKCSQWNKCQWKQNKGNIMEIKHNDIKLQFKELLKQVSHQ